MASKSTSGKVPPIQLPPRWHASFRGDQEAPLLSPPGTAALHVIHKYQRGLNFYPQKFHSSNLLRKLQWLLRRFALDKCKDANIIGGYWWVCCSSLWEYKLLCHTCQVGHFPAKWDTILMLTIGEENLTEIRANNFRVKGLWTDGGERGAKRREGKRV